MTSEQSRRMVELADLEWEGVPLSSEEHAELRALCDLDEQQFLIEVAAAIEVLEAAA